MCRWVLFLIAILGIAHAGGFSFLEQFWALHVQVGSVSQHDFWHYTRWWVVFLIPVLGITHAGEFCSS